MGNVDRLKAAIKALALGDTETSQELGPQLLDGDAEYLHLFVTATSCIFVERHFKSDHSLEQIRAFAEETSQQFREATPPVNQLTVEVVVRAIWGEEHLLDDVRGRDQYITNVALIRKIGFDSDEVKASIDSILNEAKDLADEWAAEE